MNVVYLFSTFITSMVVVVVVVVSPSSLPLPSLSKPLPPAAYLVGHVAVPPLKILTKKLINLKLQMSV